MKTSFKRAAAWLLTVLMILSCVPALATESVTEFSNGSISLYAVTGAPSNRDKEYSVDHIDIGVDLEAVVNINGVEYKEEFTIGTSDAQYVTISAAYADGSSVIFTRGDVSTSTDNAGNSQIRLKGEYPIGSYNNPITYTVTLTKDITFTVNGESVTVPVTLSTSVKYWSEANICPGARETPSGESGIDLKLGTGEGALGSLYIQKTVKGVDLTEDMEYTFEIYTVSGSAETHAYTVNVPVDAGSENQIGSTIVSAVPYGTYKIVETEDRVGIAGYTVTTAYTSEQTQAISSTQKTASFYVENNYTPATTSVTATKSWVDNDNVAGYRPNKIVLMLQAKVGGNEYNLPENIVAAQTVEADESGNWTATWENLPKKDASGNDITYNVVESAYTGTDATGKLDYYTAQTGKDDSGNFIITNTLAFVDVSVTKIVNGSFGDRSKEFNFSASYTTVGSDGTTTTVDEGIFKLKHGNSETFEKVPVGATFTVIETNEGYTVLDVKGSQVASGTETGATQTIQSVSATDKSLTFNNRKDGTPDTGVVLDSLPYIVILAVVLLGVVLMVRKRRREDD